MSKSRPAPLSIPGMPRKGEAAPALTSLETPASTEQGSRRDPPAGSEHVGGPDRRVVRVEDALPTRLSSRVQATIAVTVRLDERRYERMKTWGSGRRVTNQEIIVAALDRLFVLDDEEREQAIAAVRK